MEERRKIPDQKLKVGAWITIVTSIISIISMAIILIIALVGINDLVGDGSLSKGAVVAILVIGVAIGVVIAGLFIRWARKVLRGESKDAGKALGIVLVVFAGIALVGALVNRSPTALFTLLIDGLNLAGGILLIIGKYETETQTVTIVNSVNQSEVANN